MSERRTEVLYEWPDGDKPAKRLYVCPGCGAWNVVISLVHSRFDFAPDCAGRPVCVEVMPVALGDTPDE
jgi:hypothetical protein